MSEQVERMLPLYEGKMGHQFDHRAATFVGVGDTDVIPSGDREPASIVLPRYWVRESVVSDRLARRSWGTCAALLGFRRVARNTDERTVIAALVPFGAASYGWIISAGPGARELGLLVAQYNSFIVDYVLRQFLSQPSIPQVTFEQIPVLSPQGLRGLDPVLGDTEAWLLDRAVALSSTGLEMHALASELGRVPRTWAAEGRGEMRIELDAAMFHLYGIGRDDVDYIMDTFPIVRRKDEAAHGEYRIKRLILEVYDQMATAIADGSSYRSPLEEVGGPLHSR